MTCGPLPGQLVFQSMQKNMEKLKVDSEVAYAWIEQLDPKTWIKAFFSEFPRCDMLLNNHSEVFNRYISFVS
jgi:hypothetical protein